MTTGGPGRSEGELLTRAQEGDAAAFEALVAPLIPTVRRYARSFASGWAEADDVAQDALLRAYRSIRSFRGDADLGTWLFRITRNVCIDRTRSRWWRQRERESASVDALVDVGSDAAGAPDRALEASRARERLWRALRELPPKHRSVIVLHEIEGLSYPEIAAIEEVPLGTVRSRLARARASLGRALGAKEERPGQDRTRPAFVRARRPTGGEGSG